ncbi:restriction endonuclease subunit S [Flavobacterium psychrophilum]|uniref:restriction endonuclease subunit S n=1 Tax=Flavobacterium psychrophilum TaxID=96345 RepID=UPI0029D79011|nr:restriction endonuclease subunit S [Flavobacterium psychrophilum]ELY2017660.1 restriction endonuclease subunit S [Flavobacterium psychrophilum]
METLQPKLRFPEFNGNWELKKLGEISTITTGSTPSTLVEEYYNGDKLFVSPYDLQGNRYVSKTKTTLTELGFSKGRKISKGSVLFVCIGSTIGKVGIADNECLTNQQINSLSAKNNFSNDFIFTLLENNASEIKLLAGVNAVPQINKTDFSNIALYFPNYSEQTRIANFLYSVDEKLNLLKEKKSLLEEYKKGIMQKIFNQEIRFKDNNGNDFEAWKVNTLGEVSTKNSSNVSANKIEDNFGEYIIYGASGVLKKVDFYLQENDYISIIKDGAGVGRIFYCEGKTSVLGTMEMIKPNEDINTYFLYCLLNNIDFTAFITGSTIPHIYFKDYSKVKCGIPCYAEQTKIANFLSAIDKKIELVSNQIQDTQEYKKGLLQQMFV